jgi:glycine oxidase
VWIATGHYRHGILLAPVTADEVAAEVDSWLAGAAETSPTIAPFSPTRFDLA